MKQFIVTGMTCAACQARVEKAVSKVPGVETCSVSLLTNSMGVEGSASDSDIIRVVKDAVFNDHVADSGSGLRSDYRTTMGLDHAAASDDDVGSGNVVPDTLRSRAALECDSVIAHKNTAVDDLHIRAGLNVNAVGIG